MIFLFKVKVLKNKLGHEKKLIKLYDFVLGEEKVIIFDDEKYFSPEQQLRDYLKHINFNYSLKELF